MSKPESQADTGTRFEALWAELKLLLEWHKGFAFYLVFGDDSRVAMRLRQRVEDFSMLRTMQLQWLRPEHPQDLVAKVLAAVLPSGAEHIYVERHAPVWLELTKAPNDPTWQRARQAVLSALNKRRGALERDCPRPLFLHLPEAMAPEIVTWAPDLWSVRQYIALLPSDPPAVSLILGSDAKLEQNLQRLGDVAATERAQGHLEIALDAAREHLELSRSRVVLRGETPQALRELSVSLHNLGRIESDCGRLDAAREAFSESLALHRCLVSVLGETPQSLLNLAQSIQAH